MKTLIGAVLAAATMCSICRGEAEPAGAAVNLALFATPATSFVSGHETLEAINDGFEPRGEGDHSHGAYGNWRPLFVGPTALEATNRPTTSRHS